MKLFDTHFHWDGTTDPKQIIKEAEENYVTYFVCNGWNLQTSQDACQFASTLDNCWFTIGIHPHNSSEFDGNFEPFLELTLKNKFVAIGEIGLDYYYENSNRQTQLQVMEKFVQFALGQSKPIIVHCRDKNDKFDAYCDIYQILKDFTKDKGKFVLHCFTGNLEWLNKYAELDAYFGITGMITFPKAANIREITKNIPDNKLLLETDSPYLAPIPYRGKTNFPKYLLEIAKKTADVKNIDLIKLAELTTENAFRFFGKIEQ